MDLCQSRANRWRRGAYSRASYPKFFVGLTKAGRCLNWSTVEEALPYALDQILGLLRTSSYGKSDPQLPPYEWQRLQLGSNGSAIDEESLSPVANPFLVDTVVADMLRKFLGCPHKWCFGLSTLLADLPVVALYIADLRRNA
jgi:hypothetical protein